MATNWKKKKKKIGRMIRTGIQLFFKISKPIVPFKKIIIYQPFDYQYYLELCRYRELLILRLEKNDKVLA